MKMLHKYYKLKLRIFFWKVEEEFQKSRKMRILHE